MGAGAAVGAAVGIGSSIIAGRQEDKAIKQQAKAQKRQVRFQQAAARRNAKRAREAADDAIERGAEVEADFVLQNRQNIANLRANAAARGVDVDTGSAAELVVDAERVSKVDRLRISDNARREAAEFLEQGEEFDADAQRAAAASRDISRAARIQRRTNLISTATSIGNAGIRSFR